MTNQQQKNRRTILLLFGMTIVPFCIAWFFSLNPNLVTANKTNNNGVLITPPIETAINVTERDFIGIDKFSSENLKELQGRWILTLIIPQSECQQVCLENIHKTKQLWLMLNRDLTRVRRVAVVFNDVNPVKAESWWQWDCQLYDPKTKNYIADKNCQISLLRVKAGEKLKNKLKQVKQGAIPDGMLFLIDPLGNIMMYYEPGFDPYKVVKDLKKLLSVSQIG
jgi:cytochrome oxidase Cu insertion factor (SCO1/SenC/PrrC family)